MANTANITITGNLTRDPQTFGEAETLVARFTVAVNSRTKEGGEWRDHASFFQVVTFRRLAEQCAQSLVKGQKVCVSGECVILPKREREGKTFQDVEVSARAVEFLSPREDAVAVEAGGLGAGWGDDGEVPF